MKEQYTVIRTKLLAVTTILTPNRLFLLLQEKMVLPVRKLKMKKRHHQLLSQRSIRVMPTTSDYKARLERSMILDGGGFMTDDTHIIQRSSESEFRDDTGVYRLVMCMSVREQRVWGNWGKEFMCTSLKGIGIMDGVGLGGAHWVPGSWNM